MRKKLIFIGGTIGVGKTACVSELKKLLPRCACLEGDACADLVRVRAGKEIDRLVLENIAGVLGNFVSCPQIENVIFAWSMHERNIAEKLLARLGASDFDFYHVTLTASREAIAARLSWDIRRGSRRSSQLIHAIDRLPLYDASDSIKLDTDRRTPREVATKIFSIITSGEVSGYVYGGAAARPDPATAQKGLSQM